MRPTRLAVVGPGLMGDKHIALVRGNPVTELVGIVQPDPTHAKQLEEQLGIPVVPDIESCLAQQKPDGVIISSPNVFHFEQASACARAGIPMLIEKPITDEVDEALALVDLIESLGVKALIGHHRAHSPLVSTARRVIEDGSIGRLVAFQGSAVFRKPAEYFKAAPWRTRPGGGPILINLIHEIGMMRSLCGEIASVQAQTSSRIRGFVVEDSAAITVAFENGGLGVFILSDAGASARSWEQTNGENPIYFNAPEESCYTITGTRGTLHFPTLRLESFATEDHASWTKPFETSDIVVDRHDPLQAQLDNFVAVIRGEAEPVVTAQDGLKNLQIIDAIRRSATSGRTIVIGE